MTIEKRPFGKTAGGESVDCFSLSDGIITVEILTYGGVIRSIVVPVADSCRDIALGFDDVAGYESQNAYIGALIGRVGNRIGNARFSLNGKEYALDANDGHNSLHGGFQGFDKKIWAASEESEALVLSIHSFDGECGFPGNLSVKVRYSVVNAALSISYLAKCDMDTPISLTNHCYFNLSGHNSGSVENHMIRVVADSITKVDESLIPTGEVTDISNTPFDLRELTTIKHGLSSNHPQILFGNGFDHNYVLSRSPEMELSTAAILQCDDLRMICCTTQPGIQFYSGNHLSCSNGKENAAYGKHAGLCLETQGWPDAVNHVGFPDSVLRKGESYSHLTTYSFEAI